MLSWFKKRAVYEPCVPECNPGIGSHASLVHAGDVGRTERLDLVEILSGTLSQHELRHSIQDRWLVLDKGLMLHPQRVSFELLDDGRVHTVTTVSVCHPVHMPSGLFEYQHTTAETATDAVAKGFDSWVRLDLTTLREAVHDDCGERRLFVEFDVPGTVTAAPFKRRVIFGDTMHYVRNRDLRPEDEHPFCPCCLFTESSDAFKPLIESDEFVGLRLFASRSDPGDAQADCRANGVDWPDGAEALVRYAAGWRDRGLEFRKQYVVIRTMRP